ncbi:hypothetical protein CFC21_089855 [Triticum aestivum]|uniref:Uncharacterized protein n=2 Tax=Triticum aestivum TaxID=4565 RepID=A0A3B6PR90_WHEAT|nr:hypothetical protein CFC21_089855 [Triticum aestivum]
MTLISHKMRSCSSRYFTLAAAVILLLVLMAATEAEAIRLDAEVRASLSSCGGNSMSPMQKTIGTNGTEGSAGATSETKRSVQVAADEVRAVAHKLPEFHEDYYGPSDHIPRHH